MEHRGNLPNNHLLLAFPDEKNNNNNSQNVEENDEEGGWIRNDDNSDALEETNSATKEDTRKEAQHVVLLTTQQPDDDIFRSRRGSNVRRSPTPPLADVDSTTTSTNLLVMTDSVDDDEKSRRSHGSKYDFDMNWDMIGHKSTWDHLKQPKQHQHKKKQQQQPKQQKKDPESPLIELDDITPSLKVEDHHLKSISPIDFNEPFASSNVDMTTYNASQCDLDLETSSSKVQSLTRRRTQSTGTYRTSKDTATEEDEDDYHSASEIQQIPNTDDFWWEETNFTATPVSSTTTSSNSSSTSTTNSSTRQRRRFRQRPQRLTQLRRRPPLETNSTSTSMPTTNDSHTASSSSSLRLSLDMGMATLRRWVRSRTAARSSRSAAIQLSSLGDEDFFATRRRFEQYPPPIQEEEEPLFASTPVSNIPARQRAFSEPNSSRIRSFFFGNRQQSQDEDEEEDDSSSSSSRNRRRTRRLRNALRYRLPRSNSNIEDGATVATSTSLGAASIMTISDATSVRSLPSIFYRTTPTSTSATRSTNNTLISQQNDNDADTSISRNSQEETPVAINNNDPHRAARSRWMLINRRFQLIITFVALLFSLLLFSILVCWVVLTSAYVVSIEKDCDVPLKRYFWLATIQLILDVFRTDIMKHVLRWDPNARGRIPTRVIFYNLAYLTYAMAVLRMGIRSVFNENTTCADTASDLFRTSVVFVSLSISAWMTIILGYLGPFCFVAIILTRNGYSPTVNDNANNGNPGTNTISGVFPSMYGNTSNGAPPDCINRMRVVLLEEFPLEYPKECCICMNDFLSGDVIVATECHHVFHKHCCEEWLRQARTCPVCRTDIVASLYPNGVNPSNNMADFDNGRIGMSPFRRGDFHHEVTNLLRLLRQHEEQSRERDQRNADDDDSTHTSITVTTTNNTVELRSFSNRNTSNTATNSNTMNNNGNMTIVP